MKQVTRGRALAAERINELESVASRLAAQLGRQPTLAIVAGADPVSRKFVQIKQDALAALDLAVEAVWLQPASSTDEVLVIVRRLNEAAEVDGIFLQFPLPAGIDAQSVASALALEKDIDCSSKRGLQRLLDGASLYEPAAPAAARDLLRDALGELRGRQVIILGVEDDFAIALKVLLEDAAAECAVQAQLDGPASVDAIVVTEGYSAGAISANVTNIGVLLDAGYYLPARADGWLPEELTRRIELHIIQYGNVGPLTVAHLAEATLAAARTR